MKKTFIFIALFSLIAYTFAQSGFVSIGSSVSDPKYGTVTYTYGQIFASYIEKNGVGSVTEGVQQPYLIITDITDEICQDLDSTARYENYDFSIPIQVAGTFADSNYRYPSYFGYDSITRLVLTVNPIYFHQDTLLVYTNQLPYLYAHADGTYDTITTPGVSRVVLKTIHDCDSTIDVALYAITCPNDTQWTAPYNVCLVPAVSATLPQPTILPLDTASPVLVSNNAPKEFIVDDTNIVTWTYQVADQTLTCDQNVIVNYPPCGGTFYAYDADSNQYNTVRVSCHCWTLENISATHYTDGTDIPNAWIYNAPGYSDTTKNLADYGRLYDWYSAVNVPDGYTGPVSDTVQGICPLGWHVPTSVEYADLSTYGSDALKSTNMWIVPGNNSTGWTAVPGGYYSGIGYYNMTGNAYYWSSDIASANNAEYYKMTFSCDYNTVEQSSKTNGYSVRCIKN
ncbi:MAG: fibrobacter succinogenes major paralogous domain-containing protein [Bacteroidales bacterium]|nr:fibrobacter succinogenes major paralogous domain-containing protein [Bacteroidales bacterium]